MGNRCPSSTEHNKLGLEHCVVANMQTPTLMVAGVHDKQVNPMNVSDLYADIGTKHKVLINLSCASHAPCGSAVISSYSRLLWSGSRREL
jgi:hypothetical protein